MRELIRWAAQFAATAALLLLMFVPAASQDNGAAPEVNPDALILSDFQQRITTYLELHKEAAKDAPKLKETDDPAKIRESQVRLGQEIRAARKNARPGDIFTPQIRTKFRALMYPEMKGAEGREAKETIKEDSPKAVPLKVNADYPEGAPLPTVPPNLLAALPQLPEELEYRIIGKHLILRDVKANIIVDVIPNAIR